MKSAKIGYGLLLMITILLIIVHNAYHIYLLLAVEVFLPIFLYLYVLYCKNCLAVELLAKKTSCHIGENTALTMKLTNAGIFPVINIQVSIRFRNRYLAQWSSETIITSVASNQTQLLNFNLASEHCGFIELAVAEVIVLDPLSIFCKRTQCRQSKVSVAVMPNIVEHGRLPFCESDNTADTQESYSADKSGDDPSEVFGIREYRIGDRRRQIHWKLSLKQNCLMVREFSMPVNEHCVLFIDFNVTQCSADALDFVDHMLERALSLSRNLQRRSISHSIAWFDGRRGVAGRLRIQSGSDLFKAVRHMMSVPLYAGEAKGKNLIKKESNIIYFEPNISAVKGVKVS